MCTLVLTNDYGNEKDGFVCLCCYAMRIQQLGN